MYLSILYFSWLVRRGLSVSFWVGSLGLPNIVLQHKINNQDDEIMMLHPLKDIGVNIRKGYFATYIRSFLEEGEVQAEER